MASSARAEDSPARDEEDNHASNDSLACDEDDSDESNDSPASEEEDNDASKGGTTSSSTAEKTNSESPPGGLSGCSMFFSLPFECSMGILSRSMICVALFIE